MIFVTVGTHEQQFNRLIKEVDELVRTGFIKEEVLMQLGTSDFIPKHCSYVRYLPYDEMEHKIAEARIVITHGGPASFIQSLKLGKKPIVVPRLSEYKEHINNHQLEFCEYVKENGDMIFLVKNIHDLKTTIITSLETAGLIPTNELNNNLMFNQKFEEMVVELLK